MPSGVAAVPFKGPSALVDQDVGEAETSASAGASLLTGPKGEDRAAVASGPGQGMDGKNTGLGYDGCSTLSAWRSHIPSGCQVYE